MSEEEVLGRRVRGGGSGQERQGRHWLAGESEEDVMGRRVREGGSGQESQGRR